jgi:3-hydroxyacyl-CoA dehydrogenase/enoyl-CoA hydratase/3-hydroxybutyryl-CoA epimerase
MSVFRVEWRERGLAHLVMDHPDRKLNVLDEVAITGLEAALTELEARRGTTGVILRSGKDGSFIAGADVDAIGALTDREQVRGLIRRAHAAFGRLASLATPTVAAIDGVCLGGGCELALACDSRVASLESRTQIGLPEVLLGLFPGFGGSVRLPKLVGYPNALDLILTGRSLDGKRAERMGLVWRAVPAAWLLDWAETRALELGQRPPGARRDRWRPRTTADRALSGNPFGRSIVFQQARRGVLQKTGGHYPAPLAALDTIERNVGQAEPAALQQEADAVSALIVGPVCKNLVRIFHLNEAARRATGVSDPSVEPARVERFALAGAGVMGGGIAELLARHGIEVRLRDIRPESLQKGLQTVRAVIDERGRKRRMKSREKDAQMAHITPTLELNGIRRADFALEAVVEDLDVKRRVFGEIEVRIPETAVLATNTSSLSVNALAEGLRHPERFVGLHFFNPVHRMPLVEVVRGAKTGDRALVTAVALARRLGKTPVVVNDAPGFIVNRVLMPYLREGLHLLEEGYPVTDIDASMRRFGMPMGPFEVVDEVGLDVAMKVADVLGKAFPQRMAPAPLLARMVEAGRLGRKSGSGFYRRDGRRRVPDDAVRPLLGLPAERRGASHDMLSERMAMAMINESAWCLEDRVVSDAGSVDLAMIFGTGFPPFRGGPLRYADTLGLAAVVTRLRALRAEKGERFEPCPGLVRRAEARETFTQPVVT